MHVPATPWINMKLQNQGWSEQQPSAQHEGWMVGGQETGF
jgi:hypothetical protein